MPDFTLATTYGGEVTTSRLSDSDGTVSEEYGGLYIEVNGHRRVSMRAVFVVNENRVMRYRRVADERPTQSDWPAVRAALPTTP